MNEPHIDVPPARPCPSCPYRRDCPSGLWHAAEYDKLARYDLPTGQQPPAVFMCHQYDRATRQRVCAGWAAVIDDDHSMALRMAVLFGSMSAEAVEATRAYTTDVPLFASGAEAAAHGKAHLRRPSRAARAAIAKVVARRTDILITDPKEPS